MQFIYYNKNYVGECQLKFVTTWFKLISGLPAFFGVFFQGFQGPFLMFFKVHYDKIQGFFQGPIGKWSKIQGFFKVHRANKI